MNDHTGKIRIPHAVKCMLDVTCRVDVHDLRAHAVIVRSDIDVPVIFNRDITNDDEQIRRRAERPRHT